MKHDLNKDQVSTVTVLLTAGKTIKEISKFADLDRDSVTAVARKLDLDPPTATMRRAKELYGSSDGLTYQEVADTLRGEKRMNEGDPVHYLTVSTWVANYGWSWGGASDGDYAPTRTGASGPRSRYTLRLSKSLDAEINAPAQIDKAAAAAWDELRNDRTRIVMVAAVKGAAAVGATDTGAVKKALLAAHGDEIRTARA